MGTGPEVAGFYPRSVQAELVAATIAGDPLRVKAALNEGGRPNRADTLGDTPVLWAAVLGQVAVLGILVEHGGDLTQVNRQGDNAFHAAIRQGHAAVLERFLTPAVPVEKPNARGETLWDLALSGPTIPVILALVKHGARPDWAPAQAARRLVQGLSHSHQALEAVLRAGGGIGWDTDYREGTPWDLVRERIDLAQVYRPEGAPVLAYRPAEHPRATVGVPTQGATVLPFRARRAGPG
jgi:hypothetical protein